MRARVLVLGAVVLVLLVPAAALTFARVVEPSTGFWIRLEAFTALALPLYAAAALLLALRLAVRRRWRTPAAAVLVLALAGVGVHAWWCAPQVTGANPPAAEGAEPVVVMTANVSAGRGDPIEVVRMASEDGVDLLVVQEITEADLADMERAGLDDLLPYRVGAPGYGGDEIMVFASTELGQGVPLDLRRGGWVVAMGDLTVVAAHPWAPTDPAIWSDDLAKVRAAAAEHDADIVVGDLNATTDHAPMRALEDDGYRDVGELANQGWQPTWPASGQVDVLGIPVPSLTQIDHVLIGPRLAALGMHTREIPGSDHRAVVAQVASKE
ncbi:endonuclease/exonuclease/phosphatase family protein [Nocardioides pyridinolyticus]